MGIAYTVGSNFPDLVVRDSLDVGNGSYSTLLGWQLLKKMQVR